MKYYNVQTGPQTSWFKSAKLGVQALWWSPTFYWWSMKDNIKDFISSAVAVLMSIPITVLGMVVMTCHALRGNLVEREFNLEENKEKPEENQTKPD